MAICINFNIPEQANLSNELGEVAASIAITEWERLGNKNLPTIEEAKSVFNKSREGQKSVYENIADAYLNAKKSGNNEELIKNIEALLPKETTTETKDVIAKALENAKTEEEVAKIIIHDKEAFSKSIFYAPFENEFVENADKVLAEVSKEELNKNLRIELSRNPFKKEPKPVGQGIYYTPSSYVVKIYYKDTFLGHLPNPNMYRYENNTPISNSDLYKLNGNLSKAEISYLQEQRSALQAFYNYIEDNNLTNITPDILEKLNISVSKTAGELNIVPASEKQLTSLSETEVDYLDITDGQYLVIDRQDVYEGGKFLGNITPEMYKELGIDAFDTIEGVPANFPRYVSVIPQKDGKSIYIPIRPDVLNTTEQKELLTTLTETAQNWKATPATGVDADNLKKELDSKAFIAVSKAETHFGVSPEGNIYVEIKPDATGVSTKVFVNKIPTSLNDLINQVQKSIETNPKYEALKNANIRVSINEIKKSIPKEVKKTDKAFANKLKTGTRPNPTKNRRIIVSFDKSTLEKSKVTTKEAAATPITEEVITPKVKPVATLETVGLNNDERTELEDLQSKVSTNSTISLEEVSRLQDLNDRNQNSQLPNPNDLAFSIGVQTKEGFTNIEKAKDWVKSVLPETIVVEELNGLFDNIVKHGTTFGAFMDNVIYLSSKAPLGTEYHEAFHAVYRLLSTDSEIKTYLNIAKKEKGKVSSKELNEFRNAATNRTNLTEQELEDLYYEEYLADKFKTWMKSKPSGSLLNKLFKKIANWIKSIFNSKTELDTLFADIDTGKFRTAVPVTNRFTNRNMDPAFTLIPDGIQNINGISEYTYSNPDFSRMLINTIGAKVFKEYTSKDNTLTKEQIVDKLIKEEAAKYDLTKLVVRLNSLPVEERGTLIQQALKRRYMLSNPMSSKIITDEVNKAIKFFDFKEDVDDNTYDGSEGKTERFDVEAWSIGGFSSMGSIAKQYIGFTTYNTINEITGLEEEVAVDSNKLYNGVLRALASTNEDNMLNRLEQYSQDTENAKALYQRMVNDFGITYDSENNAIATKRISEFKSIINAFKKEKVDYITIVIDPITGKAAVYNANQKDTKKIQVEQWGSRYLTLSKKADAKKIMTKALFDSYEALKNTNVKTAPELDRISNTIKTNLEKVGIKVSLGLIRYSINSNTYNSTEELGSNLSPEQLKNYNTFKGITPITLADLDALRTIITKGNSPFEIIGDKDTAAVGKLEKIAESNSIFDETVGTSNFQNADGKQVFQLINPSLALEVTRELNNPEYRSALLRNAFLSENLLLNHPLEQEIFSGIRIALLDGIRENTINESGNEGINKKSGTTFGSFDGRSFLLTSHSLFLNQKNIKKDDKIVGTTAKFNIAQNEASNTAYLVDLPVENYYNDNGITTKAVADLTTLLKQEYNRINQRNAEIKAGVNPIKDVHNGKLRGLKFWNFAWLETANKDAYTSLENDAKNGIPFEESFAKVSDIVNNALTKHIEEAIDSQFDILKTEGIVNENNNNVLLYGDEYLKTGIYNEKYKGNLRHYLGDFLLNDYVNSYSFNQFIDGDPSTRKDAVDYVKRNKARMASGINMGTGSHKVAYIKDIEKAIDTNTLENVPQERLDELKTLAASTGRNYKEVLEENNIANINTADAQSIITLDHRIAQLKAWGKYSPKVESIYNKLKAGEKLSWEDTQTLVKNDAGLNSVKSVTAGFTIDDNGVENFDTQVYHKLSEFTLTRGIASYKDSEDNWQPIKGREYWHNLLNEMERNTIDQVIYESGSKLATTNPVAIIDGKYDLSKSFVNVPNKYKRLQVETPSNKLKITAGTQLIQLIDSEQVDSTEVEYLGTKTTIGALRKEYQNLLAVTRGNSLRKVMTSLFKENGDPDLRKAANKFLDSLEASAADASLLEFFSTTSNGDPKYNWNLPSVIDKFEQLFLAQFGSGVLAQKVPGFKLSLVSSTEFNLIREKATGRIIRTDEYLADTNKAKYDTDSYEVSELKHNVKDPKTGDLYSEVVIPAHFQLMYDLKPGDAVPSELFSMLGYRIPTQDKHSMMSIRVVDVLPAEYGSIVLAPKEIVYLSGADFDIDSLFVQRPDFYVNEEGNAVKYGTATTDEGKFKEYLAYQKENNKDFKKLLVELGPNKEVIALQQLKLPSDAKELKADNNKYGEQNDGINNNNILTIQTKMLTNEVIAAKIAKTPATIEALAQQAKEISKLKETTAKTVHDVHSINGKYEAHKNNSTGKANIGPAANGNIINALVSKEGVKLHDNTFALTVDGNTYNSFAGFLDSNGDRKNDTLSTILSAMTDNAKERLAAELNLTIDMLSPVIYMISLGMPLKQAMLLVNQPIIKEYADLKNTAKYTIKTDQDPTSSFDVINKIKEKYDITKLNKNELSTEVLESNIKQDTFDASILSQFLEIEKQSESYFKIANLLKLNKGLGTSFDDIKSITDTLVDLQLENVVNGVETLNNKGSWEVLNKDIPFDLRPALLNNHTKENLKYLSDVLKASEKTILTQSKVFKRIFNLGKGILKTKLSNKKQAELDMKRDLLGFLSIKGYKHLLSQSTKQEDKDRLNSISESLLYPELDGKTLADQLVELKGSEIPEIANNTLIQYLTPLFKYNSDGTPNENNKYGIDLVTGRQRIRENPQYIEELIDSYRVLYLNKDTRDFAVNLFNYLLIKDGARFRDKSFVKYLAPFVFKQVSNALDVVVDDFSKGTNNTTKSMGMNASEIMQEFLEIYASYNLNENNLNKVDYYLEAPTTTKEGDVITYDLLKGWSNKLDKEKSKALLLRNQDYLNKSFASKFVNNQVQYIFPLFVNILGEVHKLSKLTTADGTNKTSNFVDVKEDVPVGVKASYTKIQQIGRKGELPYARTIEESRKLEDDLIGKEILPAVKVAYESNTMPPELMENFEEEYYNDEEYSNYDPEAALEAQESAITEEKPVLPSIETPTIKVFLGKDSNEIPILGILERNKTLFNNANISAVISFDNVIYDQEFQNIIQNRKTEDEEIKEYIDNLSEFYYLIKKAGSQNPLNPTSIVHGFQIKSKYKKYLDAFIKYKGLPIDSNIVFFAEDKYKGYKLESLLVHEAAHSFINPGINLSSEQINEIIKAFKEIARFENEYYGLSSGNYLKEELAKGNNDEIIPVLAELYLPNNNFGYYVKKILTKEQVSLLESVLFKPTKVSNFALRTQKALDFIEKSDILQPEDKQYYSNKIRTATTEQDLNELAEEVIKRCKY